MWCLRRLKCKSLGYSCKHHGRCRAISRTTSCSDLIRHITTEAHSLLFRLVLPLCFPPIFPPDNCPLALAKATVCISDIISSYNCFLFSILSPDIYLLLSNLTLILLHATISPITSFFFSLNRKQIISCTTTSSWVYMARFWQQKGAAGF